MPFCFFVTMSEMLHFKYSTKGIALTERFEAESGPVLTAYWDVLGKVYTIGWGHTGPEVIEGLVWTYAQCLDALHNDFHWAENVVNAVVTYPINQNEFDALVDFEFNTGKLPKSTLLIDLNEGKVAEAAKQFEEWKYAKGKIVAGLLRRRLAEGALFLEATNDQPGS